VKFKDADLIGIPTQVIIGEKNLKNGLLKSKTERQRAVTIKVGEAIEKIRALINN